MREQSPRQLLLDCNHYSPRFYQIKNTRAAPRNFTHILVDMFNLLKVLFFVHFTDHFLCAEFEPPNKFSMSVVTCLHEPLCNRVLIG
jgi:hypothetical protein